MTDDPFDRLLDAMPKIAEAVNVFASSGARRATAKYGQFCDEFREVK